MHVFDFDAVGDGQVGIAEVEDAFDARARHAVGNGLGGGCRRGYDGYVDFILVKKGFHFVYVADEPALYGDARVTVEHARKAEALIEEHLVAYQRLADIARADYNALLDGVKADSFANALIQLFDIIAVALLSAGREMPKVVAHLRGRDAHLFGYLLAGNLYHAVIKVFVKIAAVPRQAFNQFVRKFFTHKLIIPYCAVMWYNIFMDNLKIYNEIVAEWRRAGLNTVEALDFKLRDFKVMFAYHSGRIENSEINYHDTREIFDRSRVSSFTGDPRTLFQQQNQKDCYEFLKAKIIKKEPLTARLVKEMHFQLCKGTYDDYRFNVKGERPGEYKKHDYVTGVLEVGEPPENVESAVASLLKEVKAAAAKDAFTAACYLHAVFENIHPFADGNGRAGRTAMNYYLMINDHPPVIVREEDRKEYYKALEAFDANEDLSPLKEFLRAACIITWDRREDRFR